MQHVQILQKQGEVRQPEDHFQLAFLKKSGNSSKVRDIES